MVPYFTKTGFQKYVKKEKMNPAGTPRKTALMVYINILDCTTCKG